MNGYEIYEKFRDIKGLKDGQVAEKCGFGRSTFSDWKSGRSIPKQAKLEKIADVLEITTYELRYGSKPSTPVFELSHIELIDLYSQLTESQKEHVLNTMRLFVESNK